jgi:hypothetical protein
VYAAWIDQIGSCQLVNPAEALQVEGVQQLALFFGDFDIAVNRVSNLRDILEGHRTIPLSLASASFTEVSTEDSTSWTDPFASINFQPFLLASSL